MPAYRRFDPAPCGFPSARVGVLPSLRWRSLALARNPLARHAHWYRRGRYALQEACRLAGVGPGAALLVPAYHCRTMLDPAVSLGAQVIVYPLRPDLSPDVPAIERLLDRAGTSARALLAAHYFGFPRELDELAALCARRDVVLIEDCSHVLAGAMVGQGARTPMGTTGRYAIASPYKFFPAPDGGLLWSNGSALAPVHQPSPGMALQARAVLDLLRSLVRRRVPPRAERLGDELRRLAQGACAPPREWLEEVSAPSGLYDPSQGGTCSLAASRWIARRTDLRRLVDLRRAHFRQWLDAVRDLPGCHALYAQLPDDCVPYMFPLLIERPHEDFVTLKRLGLPIWRWDELAVSDCTVAESYRLRLLHLPCHQELLEEDMRWMTTAVRAVCGRAGT
ncbi:MAG TPA: DegT/DnrJ/EryC1/StrS family aminotransferase [Burkholderiaceae bacterium]|nr:DegT/DnrJ/EryC1/StrS family aminotransferase [Burkholderiaceae bacterium]